MPAKLYAVVKSTLELVPPRIRTSTNDYSARHAEVRSQSNGKDRSRVCCLWAPICSHLLPFLLFGVSCLLSKGSAVLPSRLRAPCRHFIHYPGVRFLAPLGFRMPS